MKIFLFGLSVYIIFTLSLYPYIKEVTLNECIEIALQNHPELKAAEEDERKAKANYKIAQSKNKLLVNGEIKTIEFFEKEEDASGSDTVLDITGIDSDIGLFAGPTLTYNLIDPQRVGIENSTRLSIDLLKMNSVKVKKTIICNVKRSYYGYLFAKENSELMGKLVDKFKKKLQMAKALFKRGQRPILDVSKSEVDLADAKLEYEKAKNSENMMKIDLLVSMGIINDNIEFSPSSVDELPQLRFSLQELNKLAVDYYPEIQIARYIKEINKLNISAAKSARYPIVNLISSIGFFNRNIVNNDTVDDWKEIEENLKSDNWEGRLQIGITASVPLYSGGAIQANVDSSIAEYNKSIYIERNILIKMRAMIRNYFHSMNELVKQMEISKLIEDNARKHLMLAQKSYKNGIGFQLDIQDAEMAVLKAELSFIKARYDYLIMLANLSNVVGLGEEYLCIK
ncbi:MAG: TolC family protein [Spirochaetota bacterium]|nr:TolC family protein [Spirochaetota bacterium]